MGKKLALILASALLCVSCVSQETRDGFSFETATLFGMVYDENNQPCSGARLTLDGASGPMTDIRGRFVIAELNRGDHTVVARKDGYEELSVKFSFLNRGDVLYLRMISFDQLLTRVEKAFDDRRWDEAEALLRRAAKLDSGDTVMLFMKAIRAYKMDNYTEAADYLEGILGRGDRETYVYLFLADLYERDLGDPGKAVTYLEAYLEKRADADVEKRLSELKEKQKKSAGPVSSPPRVQ